MAHFAELNIFKKVLRVLTLDNKDTQDKNGNEVESIGAKYLYDSFGGTWVKTSYNTFSGVHAKTRFVFWKKVETNEKIFRNKNQ